MNEGRAVIEDKGFNSLSKNSEIDFRIDSDAEGFEAQIENLDFKGDLFDPDTSFESNLEFPPSINYGISEEFFKLYILEKFIPKLEEYSKKYNRPKSIYN